MPSIGLRYEVFRCPSCSEFWACKMGLEVHRCATCPPAIQADCQMPVMADERKWVYCQECLTGRLKR